jgi:hypothetical protein
MNEKLIELVCTREELYDMSNKKDSDSLWKEKLRGQIGEELKNQATVPMCFIAHFEVAIILLAPKF